MKKKQRTYIAIDLKSFYASVECVERGLDPLTTNLVVADVSRTEKTICLAVSPSLKAHGISGRARLFEVIQRLREVNNERLLACYSRLAAEGKGGTKRLWFTGKSTSDTQLRLHPDWEIDYIAAVPRMALYIDYSTRVYQIYLKYIAASDIHVYSVDEVFMDVTDYLATYRMNAHQLAMVMIRDVLSQTGITATAGIGTNLYLAKVAMDIVAKHIPADKDGVRIAELDEMTYRKQLWDHRPLSDFWRVGRGISSRLANYGIDTMGRLARCSIDNEQLLYKLFGVNAELLIDHAWGWEPCTIESIKAYRPTTNSLSNGQVLTCAYDFTKARTVIMEMADKTALDLVDKRLVTDQLVLTVGYDMESLTRPEIRATYHGPVGFDHYGRAIPMHAHGTINLGRPTSSTRIISKAITTLFDRIVNSNLLIRRLNITSNHVVDERKGASAPRVLQLDLFTDYERIARERKAEQNALTREHKIQEVAISLKKRFGKNAILLGLNFAEGATARERNLQIGGHKA